NESAAASKAYRAGYNLVLDENWRGAVDAFDDLVRSAPRSEWADDASFWRCYAREQLGQDDAEVFGCFEQLLELYDDSEWLDDALSTMVRLAKRLELQGQPEFRKRMGDFEDEVDDSLLSILIALGEIGDERSVEVILEHLDKTRDEQTRARIVETLEEAESRKAIDKLLALLADDPSERVRLAALETLANHDTFDAGAELRRLVTDSSQPTFLRLAALVGLGPTAADAGTLELLRTPALGADDELALAAIDALGDTDSERAVEILTGILGQSPVTERRYEAVDALEDLHFSSAVEALLNVAREDPDPRLRRLALEALGEMETEESRDALISLLKDLNR
ncbi:MAG: HEAT repeat domain-containing protein, partial [Acidobacteriota bacterium]